MLCVRFQTVAAVGSEDVSYANVVLSARPLRSAVFVQPADGVPWQALYRFALRAETATWGGWGNLILPMPAEKDLEDPLLWRLVELFDADIYQALTATVGDMKDLSPAFYHAAYEVPLAQAKATYPKSMHDQVASELARAVIATPDPPETFAAKLQNRLTAFAGGVAQEARLGLRGAVPDWPLTCATSLALPEATIRILGGWSSDDLALLAASTHGEMAPGMRATVTAAGATLRDETVSGVDEWLTAMVPMGQSAASAITNQGLERLHYQALDPRVVFCVGDTPWDFALAVALDRLGIVARWVPASAASNLSAVAACYRLADMLKTHRGFEAHACSVSEPAAVNALINSWPTTSSDPVSLTQIEPIDSLPELPGRLYERDRAARYQATVVLAGATPLLATPLLRNVTAADVNELRWMTDVRVDGWRAFRHQTLAKHLLADLSPDIARSGGDAVSYFCPNVITTGARSLEAQTVSSRLKPLSLFEQIRSVLQDAGWVVATSDKGVYLLETAALFGGIPALVDALTDVRGPVMTMFLPTTTREQGYAIGSRRYFTLKQLERICVETEGLRELVIGLEDAGVLVRGFALKCGRCRQERVYELADVTGEFQCTRCRHRQRIQASSFGLTPKHPEPTWLYGLAEVVFQFLRNEGDLPVLNAYEFARKHRASQVSPPQYTGEIALVSPGGEPQELDIAVTISGDLWLGEATINTNLGRKQAGRLRNLATVAELLNARGVLLVSAQEWTGAAKKAAAEAFPSAWPRLELLQNGQRVSR